MKAIVSALAILVALTLYDASTAEADDRLCSCSVGYVVRACGGTLTKTEGKTAKARYQCHKSSTRIAYKKDKSKKFATGNQCKTYCQRFGRETVKSLETSSICKARPGQRIITRWNAYFAAGEKVLVDHDRRSKCPGKKK